MSDWPFDQPKNCAAITNKDIAFVGAPILQVFHDEDDHGWQFLGLGEPISENIALVCMAEIVNLDPSVKEVAQVRSGLRPPPDALVRAPLRSACVPGMALN